MSKENPSIGYSRRSVDRNELGMVISFAKKEITVEEPEPEDRELLDLEHFSSIVVVKNEVYLEDATLFQYTESRHRPDKFKFVDFARRNRPLT